MSARLLVEAEVAALVATHAQKSELKAIKAGGNK
jgi:DNA-binding FadR family transcriptional regulator